jgi:ABC-type dipeptide/oligopeptide/nickel transport system permease subunit
MMKSDFWRAFARNKGAVLGLVILIAIVVLAVFASVLFPGDPWDMATAPFQPPLSEDALLGSGMLGRDIASGIAHGARVSLLIGLTSTAAALAIGVTLGALAGFHGGKVDDAIMRFTELFQTIPNFVLAVVLVAILTPSLTTSSPPSPSSAGRRWHVSPAPSSSACAPASSCRPPSPRGRATPASSCARSCPTACRRSSFRPR